ncbi:hypothetical protein [Emticicia soli]|uniref:Uncharacterized protein n=1 Tax=Emticicia soli TaxID=2027878 RepID=A0ABW5JE53_9BACT
MKTLIEEIQENKDKYALVGPPREYFFVELENGGMIHYEDLELLNETIEFALNFGLRIFKNYSEFREYRDNNTKTLIEKIKEDKEKYALVKYHRGYLFVYLDSWGSPQRDSESHDETVKFALNFGVRIFENYDEYIDYLASKKANNS